MSTKDKVNKKLNALWIKYLPTTRSRMKSIRDAVKAIERGDITDQLRLKAAHEAHKLAGSLGTFGLKSCSDFARKIEMLLSQESVGAKAVSTIAELLINLESEIAQQNMLRGAQH